MYIQRPSTMDYQTSQTPYSRRGTSQYHGLPNQLDAILPQRHVSVTMDYQTSWTPYSHRGTSQYHGLPNQLDAILPQRHVPVPWTTKPVGRHTPTEARPSTMEYQTSQTPYFHRGTCQYHGLPNQLDAILPQRHVPVPWTTKPVGRHTLTEAPSSASKWCSRRTDRN